MKPIIFFVNTYFSSLSSPCIHFKLQLRACIFKFLHLNGYDQLRRTRLICGAKRFAIWWTSRLMSTKDTIICERSIYYRPFNQNINKHVQIRNRYPSLSLTRSFRESSSSRINLHQMPLPSGKNATSDAWYIQQIRTRFNIDGFGWPRFSNKCKAFFRWR